MQRIPRKPLSVLAALALALLAPALHATPALTLVGDRLCVSVPDSDVGSRLTLLWDETDQGDDPADWAHSHVIAPVVTAADSRYAVDLYALGITNGQQCAFAVVTAQQYKLLDKLEVPNGNTYVNTGFKDTEVYGVRFGFYGNSGNSSGGWNYIITSKESGFGVSQNNTSFSSWCWFYQGTKASNRPSVNTTSINEAAFTNRMFTLNGRTVQSGLAAGSVGSTGNYIWLNWSADGNARKHFGWWSHVSFDDENGNRILDYIPAQRYGDNSVGFYDRATGKFVTSSNSAGAFNAGTVTNDWFSGPAAIQRVARNPNGEIGLSFRGSRVQITVPAAFSGETLLIVWDDSNKGDDLAAWANTNVIADVIGATGGTWTVNISSIGVRDHQTFAVVTAHRLQLLDMLKMTSKQTYVDTGILDNDVYGVRFGFYGNESATSDNGGSFANIIGTYDADNSPATPKSGFTVGMSGASFTQWYWNYRSYKSPGEYRPTVRTTSINDVAFTNRMFTLNGTVVKSGLEAGPVGESSSNMHLGTWTQRYRFLYGWWSYVRFDDANGNAILDYIPAVRTADGKVGFYDRATMSFVTSTGTGDFTAGTVTNASFDAVHSRQTLVRMDAATVIYVR